MPTPAPRPPAQHCLTYILLTRPPMDLITWNQAAAALRHVKPPISARDLRRKYKDGGRRPVYAIPGVRGEHVSRGAVLEFYRDMRMGWLPREQRTA